jgi:hypothetical protein
MSVGQSPNIGDLVVLAIVSADCPYPAGRRAAAIIWKQLSSRSWKVKTQSHDFVGGY